MNPRLDSTDVKILKCLGIYGPRNITDVARKLGMPCETVRKRVKRLISHFSLKFPGNVYHTNLGLKKAFVFADAVPGCEQILFNCLKTNDFWIYVGRYYGRYEGCYAIYTIPKEHTDEFEEFVNQLENIGIARNIWVLWSTCLHTVNVTENWFDPESKTWIFQWDKWIEEIPTKGTKLPYTLVDPKDFPLKADYIDILILTELEVDSTITLREIAKMLNMTPEAIAYRYKNHILKHGLFEKSQIFFPRFDKATSDFFVFTFRFDENEKMARFALSLLDKPFVYALGKILGEYALIAHIYLPRNEFRRFIHSLSELVRRGILQTYEYIIEDFKMKAAQTISFEFFKDKRWLYEHDKHIKKLLDLAKCATAKKK